MMRDTSSLQGQSTARMQKELLFNVRSNPKTRSLTAVNGKQCYDPLPTKKIVGSRAPPFQTWHLGRTNIHEDTAYHFDAKIDTWDQMKIHMALNREEYAGETGKRMRVHIRQQKGAIHRYVSTPQL